ALLGHLPAPGLESAALLAVDDHPAASRRQRQPLRPAAPARRPGLCHQFQGGSHHARRKLCRPADGGLGGWAEKVRPTKASWRRSGVPPQCFSPLPRAVEGPGVRALWRIAAGTSLLREGPNSRRIFSFRRFGTKTFLIFVIPVPPHSPS